LISIYVPHKNGIFFIQKKKEIKIHLFMQNVAFFYDKTHVLIPKSQ
jgi:hypothetical protein